MNSPVLTFSAAAVDADLGWAFFPASERLADGFLATPLAALKIGGVPYATLTRGHVSVALSGTGLHYHDGRVWIGDPTFDVRPDRVVISGIVVNGPHRRSGIATQAMRDLCSVADSIGFELMLEATPIDGFKHKGQRSITRRRLVRWYTSLGFEPAYPSEGDTILVRHPRKVVKS